MCSDLNAVRFRHGCNLDGLENAAVGAHLGLKIVNRAGVEIRLHLVTIREVLSRTKGDLRLLRQGAKALRLRKRERLLEPEVIERCHRRSGLFGSFEIKGAAGVARASVLTQPPVGHPSRGPVLTLLERSTVISLCGKSKARPLRQISVQEIPAEIGRRPLNPKRVRPTVQVSIARNSAFSSGYSVVRPNSTPST